MSEEGGCGFSAAEVVSNIRPLDLSSAYCATDQEAAYFSFYSLRFDAVAPPVSHRFGWIPIGVEKIACHYFSIEQARDTCFIVHGYMDHAGLYHKLIADCLQRKQNVVIFDFPGHGLSSGERACIGSFSDYVVVLRDCLSFFSDKLPCPPHIIAQSMGGAVTMQYLLGCEGGAPGAVVDKVLLLAPLLRPRRWWGVRLAHALLSPWISRIRRKFSRNSHQREFLGFLRWRDPLQPRHISLRWVAAMLQWPHAFNRFDTSDRALLVIQGDDDKTVDWTYNLRWIQNKFPRSQQLVIGAARHHLVAESEPYFKQVTAAAAVYFSSRDTLLSSQAQSRRAPCERP